MQCKTLLIEANEWGDKGLTWKCIIFKIPSNQALWMMLIDLWQDKTLSLLNSNSELVSTVQNNNKNNKKATVMAKRGTLAQFNVDWLKWSIAILW
jgi:hypothetical protein